MSNVPPKQNPPITYVYVDGFNLYYGALSKCGPGRKWLNLDSWINKMLQGSNPIQRNQVSKIKFFSAKVSGKFDVNKPARQQLYWRAIKTLPNVEIIEGSFLVKTRKIQVTPDVSILGKIPEEKGTDVNLATHLVNDAHSGKFDVAVVVSNDSDLAGAIKIVTQEVRLPVGVINPCIGSPYNKQITQFSAFKKIARDGSILNSQFPASMTDTAGSFLKPQSW